MFIIRWEETQYISAILEQTYKLLCEKLTSNWSIIDYLELSGG